MNCGKISLLLIDLIKFYRTSFLVTFFQSLQSFFFYIKLFKIKYKTNVFIFTNFITIASSIFRKNTKLWISFKLKQQTIPITKLFSENCLKRMFQIVRYARCTRFTSGFTRCKRFTSGFFYGRKINWNNKCSMLIGGKWIGSNIYYRLH